MKNSSLKAFEHHALPGSNPAREWTLMFSAFAALVFCGFVFAGYLFWAVKSGNLSSASAEPAGELKTLDSKAINSVIASYQAAPSRTDNLVAGGQLLVDPSR